MRTQFLVSIEQEMGTNIQGSGDMRTASGGWHKFLQWATKVSPYLPCGGAGIFTPLGRIYIDNLHFEAAHCECDSPYLLATVVEQMQTLFTEVVHNVREASGAQLVFTNNNHCSLLSDDNANIWGSHENFLTPVHPTQMPLQLALRFLESRFYQGSGGVRFPSGQFIAGVRAHYMRLVTGGSTTESSSRAIHSTARNENHMGNSKSGFRYHLILADGHRSMFNTALLAGASALAFQAMLHDRQIVRLLPKPPDSDPVRNLQIYNHLADPGQPPSVHPLALATQQVFLDASRRFVAKLDDPPDWAPCVLEDWQDTLDAAARNDRAWLAARLDAFTKWALFTQTLRQRGLGWKDTVNNAKLQAELMLMNHSYHRFSDPESVFSQLDRHGALAHRTGPRVPLGGEEDPWVPPTRTRAAARARFIRDNSGNPRLTMDWSCVCDLDVGNYRYLHDPFAEEYTDSDSVPLRGASLQMFERLRRLHGGVRG